MANAKKPLYTSLYFQVIVAIVIGVVLDRRLGTSYWVLVLFFAGLALGAYSAWRLVAQALSR